MFLEWITDLIASMERTGERWARAEARSLRKYAGEEGDPRTRRAELQEAAGIERDLRDDA